MRMITTQDIIAAIEAKASETGFKPSTIGERVGQGGQFYARLKNGSRVWPETAEAVMSRLDQIQSPSADLSQEAL